MISRHLPIWEIHSDILRVLSSGNQLVLVAPTGSGKSTQVPQMLLDAGLADNPRHSKGGPSKIVILQPRRVAARTLAARVAWERNCKIGEEVGYQIRFEDLIRASTRICFVTEGVLLRWLQDDPTLSEVGAILFDEFHERNLLSDVALALVKRLQREKRPDLKMVVMSATLEAKPVAEYLVRIQSGLEKPPATAQTDAAEPPSCPILVSEGSLYPVEVRYQDYMDAPQMSVVDLAAEAVERIVNSGEPGDILVFMPGMGEINATLGAIHAARTSERLALIPLHGDLPPDDQDRAFEPNPLRKVVIATNVAETSVTIDGVRHVVDGGVARVSRYDAERGINTLFIEPISRASADQRKGRAGRTAPGVCWRLWTESGHLNRPERNTPEIQRSDLAEVVLLLHSLGIPRAITFDWLDQPEPQAVERAERLLSTLGALLSVAGGVEPDSAPAYEISPLGRQMLKLPMHPRYSRMLVEASRRNCVKAAALCAALVSGRDLLMRLGRDDRHISEARELFEGSAQSDFFTLMRAWQFARNASFGVERCRRYGIHAQTARMVEQTFDQIIQTAQRQGLLRPETETSEAGLNNEVQNPSTDAPKSDDALLQCLMAGFVDQLCVRRDTGSLDCDLTEGREAVLVRESVVQSAPIFVAASIRDIDGRNGKMTLLSLASAVKREWLQEIFPQHLSTKVEHIFDRTHRRVGAIRQIRFQDLIIAREYQPEADPVASARCLADAYLKGYFELPLLNHEIHQFIARVNLVSAAMPELEYPAIDEAAIGKCLTRAFEGMTLAKEAQGIRLLDAFHAHLAPEQVGWLDELAPLSIPWNEGKKLKLGYMEADEHAGKEILSPEVQVKLHECFQLKIHPRICEGQVPVKLWLCAPDGKRIEATCDWPAFKATAYPKLKPTLQKKYPSFTWL